MKNKITILEKYSKRWPQIAILSLIMAVLLLFSYIMVSDVLLEGYLRLAAFAFFALGLLSLFKLKEGQIKIDIEHAADDVIRVEYLLRNQVIQTEEWLAAEIASIKVDEMPNRSLYNDIMKSDRCVRFRRNNEADWIYFNQVNSKVIPLSEENALKVYNFLKAVQKAL